MKIDKKNYFLSFIIWSIIIITPELYFYISGIVTDHYQNIGKYSIHFYLIISNLILLSSIITLPFFLLKKTGSTVYSFILLFIFGLPSLLDFTHLILYDSLPSTASYIAIFSTTKNETIEFIHAYSSLKIIFGISGMVLLISLIIVLIKKVNFKPLILVISLIFIVNLINIIWRPHLIYFKNISVYRLLHTYSDYKNEIIKFNSFSSKHSQIDVKRNNVPDNETHIVIIGESTSRHHMSLYGYSRITNPRLSALKKELIIIDNVSSSAVTTVESLKDVLILRDSTGIETNFTLLDVLKKVGFKVYWISNQQFMENGYHLVSAIANRADKKIFLNNLNHFTYDEAIIPNLKEVLKDSINKKVIFIHLMGCHTDYKNRYPSAFNYFTSKSLNKNKIKAEVIDNYDNAVRYNDFVVSEIIRNVKQINGCVSLVYFSDHGEEVYDYRDFYGHADVSLSKYMVDIPFIIWGNKCFMSNNENHQESSNAKQIFSLKEFSLSYLSFLDIHLTDIRPSKSRLIPMY